MEVIHTVAGYVGFADLLGDTDFFVNFGDRQLGCGLDIIRKCSHLRVIELFAESIGNSKGFVGVECSSHKELLKRNCKATGITLVMGGEFIDMKIGKQGFFLVATNTESPFAEN